jgi:GNAT superfamily N-acetyltransferase
VALAQAVNPAIILATPDQAGVVGGLLTGAARRLLDQGIRQWPHPFPDDVVRASIDRRETYLAWQDDQPVGTLAICWDDPVFWGSQPPDAGYVHRLTVADNARGHGLGSRLLDWAADHVAANGRRWLRLDCLTVNARLRAFYEGLAFRHVRDIELTMTDGEVWPASLYERG